MNYRTLAKGALALSLGLIVGSAMATTTTTDVQKYGATFESTTSAVAPMNDYAYEVGTNVTKYAVTGGNPSGWFGAAEDESKIIAAHGGQALQLNTDAGTLTNKLESSIATQVNAGIAAAGAYIETEAKFVASDTLDAGVRGGTDDTKFAIYAYADENANPCTTNLVVYHAFPDENADGGIAFTNEIFNTLINCDDYTKLRVTMKKIDIGEGVEGNVFSVSINNGEPLASPLAIDAALEEKPTGIWFLTVEKSENDNNTLLSSVNFKGTGEVDNLAVGIIQETTTYAVDWTGSANVVVSNLTAGVQLAAGETNFNANVQLGFYPTVGSITNILVNGNEIDGVFYPLDSYSCTVAADAVVSVFAGEQTTPPTVISVATVGNATVTDNQNGTYTISVPLDNGLSSVFVNGVAVDPSLLTDNHDGTYDLDVSALTGTVNVVVATKKVRTPIGHKWFENPTIVGSLRHDIKQPDGSNSAYAPWHLGGDGDFVAGTSWTAYHEMKAFDINDIIASSGSAVVSNFHDATAGTWGAAVSMALNVALVGSDTGNNVAIAYPLTTYNGTIGEDSFLIENDIGIGFNDAAFTSDGQYLYANCYKVSGDNNRNYIYKFRVLNGLKSSGVNLEFVAKYNMGERVRSMALGQFQSGDVVYGLLDNGKVVCFDTTSAATVASELIAGYTVTGIYGDIIISGSSTATPHITIIGASATQSANQHRVDVFTLNATGTAVASTDPVISLNDAALAKIGFASTKTYCNSGYITEDEETFIFEWGCHTFYAIQWTEPKFAVDWTGSENVDVTVDGDAWDGGTVASVPAGTVVAFTPTEGNVITNVNGEAVSLRGFNLEVTEATNIVVLAGVAAPTTYTVSWADSQNVVVSNTTAGAEILINSGEFEAGTVITFYPNPGMVITNVAGEAVGHLNSFTLTVTQATNIVVIADTVQPIGRIKPDWAEQADTTKFWAWVDANGVTDYANTDYTAQYLFNADEEETVINLRIVSIEVGANATTIVVSGQVGRGIAKLNEINGVLSVATGSSLSALTPKSIPTAITYDANGDATITIPAGNGNFFRARVDFVAPSTPLVTAE